MIMVHMQPQEASLNLLDVRGLDPEILSLLTKEQQEKALRFHHEEDRLLYLGARRLEQILFPGKAIQRKPNGKPFLEEGPCFSISHSFPYVGVLVSACPVGLDIESRSRDAFEIVEKKFLPSEKGAFHDLPFLWCLKEAVYKCKGEGYLSFEEPLIKEAENQVRFEGDNYFFESLLEENHQIVACSKAPFSLVLKRVDPSSLS